MSPCQFCRAKAREGRSQAVIVSVAHLDDDERALVLGVLLEEVLTWVRTLSGSQRWFLLRDAHARAGMLLLQPRWAMSLLPGPMTRSEIRRAREHEAALRSIQDDHALW